MHKVCGLKSDFAYMKEDNSRVIIGYGLNETDSLCEWYEVYLYKKQNSQITLDIIKSAIIGDINQRITNQIVGGLVWEEKPVWFSLENQINFSQSSAPCSIKIGEYEDGIPVYVDFETKAALKTFNDACLAWKNECLENGRAEKENIDWTPYEKLFLQD